MALSDTRRKMRILALRNAAEMIANQIGSGAGPEELGVTDEEFDLLEEENKKVAEWLNARADKLDI